MEKITLKPLAKELVYRNGEDKVSFDVLSYHGSTVHEKLLGSLFVIGHIKYENEDLAYAVSLISSLAKREYYSDLSLGEQNAKSAFERTLKKLNEVLDDFFQNKDFKLNIGLVAISGENIFISRLGKFKIAMARDNEYIDVLNNIDLFSKDSEDEKQFSNIISGKLREGDKIFAYFPARPITLREKQLNSIFVSENQEGFGRKIEHLASNAANFSCCGVHIDMQQVKEIPAQAAVQYSMSVRPPVKNPETSLKAEPEDPLPPKPSAPSIAQTEPPNPPTQPPPMPEEQPRIIPAELSMAKRANIFTPLLANISKMFSFNRITSKTRPRTFALIAAIVIVPLLFLILLKNGGSSEVKNAVSKANENLKLAQSRLGQNDIRGARSLLQAALLSSAGFSGKKVDDVRQEITKNLDSMDRASEKQPVLDETADGSKIFASVVPKALLEAVADKSAVLYEDNLYVLGENGTKIYKYADAAKGKTAQISWASLESPAIAIAVDGNVYALTDAGKIVKYFKGKKSVEIDLQITPAQGSKIFTDKNSAFVYLADKINKRVYVFDKSNGTLKTAYKLDAVGTVRDISVAQDGTIWVLPADNKVWQVKP